MATDIIMSCIFNASKELWHLKLISFSCWEWQLDILRNELKTANIRKAHSLEHIELIKRLETFTSYKPFYASRCCLLSISSFTLSVMPTHHCSFQSKLILCQLSLADINLCDLLVYLSVKKSLASLYVNVQVKEICLLTTWLTGSIATHINSLSNQQQ